MTKLDMYSKQYDILFAINLLKRDKLANFKKNKESIDLTINFDINSQNRSKYKNFDGTTILPFANGQNKKIFILYEKEYLNKQENDNFNIINYNNLLRQVQAKKFDFKILLAIQSDMHKLKPISGILNKFKLMPSIKNRTVESNISDLINNIKSIIYKQVYFKICKHGIMHIPISRVNFSNEIIIKNIKFFINVMRQRRPNMLKGEYMKKISISRTMGKSFVLDPKSI